MRDIGEVLELVMFLIMVVPNCNSGLNVVQNYGSFITDDGYWCVIDPDFAFSGEHVQKKRKLICKRYTLQ